MNHCLGRESVWDGCSHRADAEAFCLTVSYCWNDVRNRYVFNRTTAHAHTHTHPVQVFQPHVSFGALWGLTEKEWWVYFQVILGSLQEADSPVEFGKQRRGSTFCHLKWGVGLCSVNWQHSWGVDISLCLIKFPAQHCNIFLVFLWFCRKFT